MKLLLLSFLLFGKDSNQVSFNKVTTVNDLEKTTQEKQWTVKLGGFIGTDLFWDTRQVVESRDGLLLFYPENVKEDINGKDINARPSFNFLALNTRLTVQIKAPQKILGADVSGMVEGWFAGISNSDMNGFAMRHAFIKMDWEKGTSLLMGQTWHPLFTENCFANTVAGSAGAPFQPFSRSPQIRLTQHLRLYRIMFYINAQRDFLSFGSAGNSPSYLRNSAVPEMGLQFICERGGTCLTGGQFRKILWGIGIDYKYIIPRIVTDSNVYTRNGLHSLMATAFIHRPYRITRYTDLGIKAKALYGQNCNEFLLLGGYAYQYYDNQPLNLSVNYSYTSINTAAAWIDIYVKGKQWETGLFGGYTQNLGSHKNIQDWNNLNSYFSRGYDIKYMYRISARAMYHANVLQFSFEPEYTVACYGNTRNSLGEVQVRSSDDYPNIQKNVVANLRVLFSAIFVF
jgi:hypothetical protein